MAEDNNQQKSSAEDSAINALVENIGPKEEGPRTRDIGKGTLPGLSDGQTLLSDSDETEEVEEISTGAVEFIEIPEPPPLVEYALTSPPSLEEILFSPDSRPGKQDSFLGRAVELEKLRQTFARAPSKPQCIFVRGAEGIGKTRLVREAVSASNKAFWGWSQQGKEQAALDGLLRKRFSLPHGNLDEVAKQIFATEVCRLISGEETSDMLHFLGRPLGFTFPSTSYPDPEKWQGLSYRSAQRRHVREFFEADAKENPTVLVFDDAQWASEEEEALLKEFADRSNPGLSIVVCYREYGDDRFSWKAEACHHTRLDVPPLNDAEAAELFHSLVSDVDVVPDSVVNDAVSMTQGSPGFLEQLVRLYRGNGTLFKDEVGQWRFARSETPADAPLSVEDAIKSRVSALSKKEKEVLEKATLFGAVFWVGGVVSLCRIASCQKSDGEVDTQNHGFATEQDATEKQVQEAIKSLVERDYLLCVSEESSTVRGEIELLFKHNLERNLIAEQAQGKIDPKEYALAAQWLETRGRSVNAEQLEFLGSLYEKSGDKVRAAFRYIQSADLHYTRYNFVVAAPLYQKVLGLLSEEDASSHLQVLHNLGASLDAIGNPREARECFEAMLEWAWLFDQKGKTGAALSRVARIVRQEGNYEEAEKRLRKAHQLFIQANDSRGIASTYDDMGRIYFLRGGYSQALYFHKQALDLRRKLKDKRSTALCVANIGKVLRSCGQFESARQFFTEALESRRTVDDKSGVIESLCELAELEMITGKHEICQDMLESALEQCRKIGEKNAESKTLTLLGECASLRGEHGKAEEHGLRAVDIAKEVGDRLTVAVAYRRLSQAYLRKGDAQSAVDAGNESLALSERIGSRPNIGLAHSVLGVAWSRRASDQRLASRAVSHFEKAVRILREMNNLLELSATCRAFALFCQTTGNAIRAGELSREATAVDAELRKINEKDQPSV